ncbi:hypothetical protein [Halosimplex pelagicum]|uniref:Uncharacterized protein n=1 Tax=Halosimplex pelagicum TaxID=869886 RepID=A0A7D5PAV1_9EURY|nr:hypothetical protein [Halosimplex pelagicum]QLH81278.1 hypothetical protein HZS54_06355 [Halosimplex pelagicum]
MTDRESLEARVAALEATVEQQAARIDDLEADLEAERQAREAAETRVDDLEATVERQDALLDALRKRMKTSRGMIGELQSRELEKGAHLRWAHVKPTLDDDLLDLHEDTVERISKDDGEYIRLPAEADPLDHDDGVALAHGDLLPIQQLAQLDEKTLQSVADARPDRLAAQIWQARQENTGDLWNDGCNGVREFLDAGELATWIRIQEGDVSRDYATKLARRTIDALLDLSNHRLYDELRSRRADGLQYKERRVVLPADAEIPGESRSKSEPVESEESAPATAGVTGD